MRIRRPLGRVESAESKAPLLPADDCAASTSSGSFRSGHVPGTPTTISSAEFTDDSPTQPFRLARPMGVVHLYNQELNAERRSDERGAPKDRPKIKKPPPPRQVESGAPSRAARPETTVDQQNSNSKRPLHRSSTTNSNSQRQSAAAARGYDPKLTRVFTRKSGFNYIFDQVDGAPHESDDSAASVQSDIERFEVLYRKVKRKLRKQRQGDHSNDSTDSEMSDESGEKKSGGWDTRQLRQWAFWFIVAFLAALTIKDVVELITEYSADPKQSDINVVFNDSMTMPNITFCMMRNQAYSHFNLSVDADWDRRIDEQLANLTERDAFLKAKWDYRMAVEGYEVISSLSSMERETESIHGTVHSITKFRTMPRLEGKRAMIKATVYIRDRLIERLQKWTQVIADRNVTFEEFTQKVGAEIVRPSMQRFQRLTFNEDLTIPTRFRTLWISEKQFCFQPWSPSADYMQIDDQGRFFTMSLVHNMDNLNNKSVDCMSVDFHGRPSSLNRFMEGKGRTRDGFDDELCMGQYHEVVVEVRAKYEMLENDDNGTICREQKDGEDSEFDCLSRCRMEMLREWCKCTPLTLSYLMREPEEELKKHPLCDYTQCILDVQSRNYTDAECQKNCRRDCTQIRYSVVHKTQGRLLRPDMTVMELQWGSFEYLSMKQDWVWSVTTFIAALGGSIGLWLGLSILSLIQGGTYVVSYFKENVIKKKIRNKQKASVTPIAPTEGEVKPKSSLAANPFETPFKKQSKGATPPPAYEQQKPTTNIQIE
ncbi:Amiloride-sensitive sodium channel subunit beta [Aphelenchoides fujianensis]|nr:Amiloride-sensitive sodium channel subunit beta [Aphelenchoides fujianensis]